MKNSISLEHAIHNEAVCNFLFTDQAYADWAITTAFYASLHYVSYKIFPLTEGPESTVHQTFASYTNGTFNSNKKHKALSMLVKQHCSDISNHYDQLKDMSWTARYKDYRQTPAMANVAKKRMERIRDYCK